MAYVRPALGKDKETAQILLALADDPREVGTETTDGFAFVVGDELYAKYLAYVDSEKVPRVPVSDPTAERRRPGRPRGPVVKNPAEGE